MTQVAHDEQDLVVRAAEGERAAFDELVRCHQSALRGWLALRLNRHHRAAVDDLAQDSFLIAYQRLADFEPGRPFGPWLRGIAHNLLRAHLRRNRPQLHAGDSLQDLFDGLVAQRVEDEDQVDRIAHLRRCLERLHVATATVVRGHYFEGLSLEDLARRSDRTASAIGMALMRARRRLAACIAAQGKGSALVGGGGA